MRYPFLAGLDATTFLQHHWQKKPLLVRGAFPQFTDPIDVRGVLALACTSEANSRLVRHKGGTWTLEHGPFGPAKLKQLPRRDWTVLVQDTNLFSAPAAGLLARFDFIARARVDDLMVSYAVPGGTVGPHVDSYDVFLLQGLGRRRWAISMQEDLAFRPGMPLKILERFRPEKEWVLESGDMLYLPPGVAHHGVAESECLTWSVGFRAPSDRELVAGFLDHLHDRLEPGGHYRDPGATPPRHRGEVPAPLIAHAGRALAAIRWTGRDVREFAGRFLSEPKAHVFFDAPRRPLSRRGFAASAAKRGLRLDARTRLLFSGTMFFMNGEAVRAPAGAATVLRRLSDAGEAEVPARVGAAFWDLAHAWYAQGFLHLRGGNRS